MKKLAELLDGVLEVQIVGDKNRAIEALAFDSRKVIPGTLFAALTGSAVDGHLFIPAAIKSGAVAILCETLPENLEIGRAHV